MVKSLKLTPGSQQSFFLNLSVTDKPAGKDARYSTPLTPTDARLMRVLLDVSSIGALWVGSACRGQEDGGEWAASAAPWCTLALPSGCRVSPFEV